MMVMPSLCHPRTATGFAPISRPMRAHGVGLHVAGCVIARNRMMRRKV
jgi:hypothetical protein